MIREDRIKDGKTIAAIFDYLLRHKEIHLWQKGSLARRNLSLDYFSS
jgi:hypothetical protein